MPPEVEEKMDKIRNIIISLRRFTQKNKTT